MSGKRPGSPSILSGFLKMRCVEKSEETKKEAATQTFVEPCNEQSDAGTQTLVEPYVGRLGDNIYYASEALPKLLYEIEPSDQRNKSFSMLIAFELERVPEENRSNLYAHILNLIRIYRGDSDLSESIDLIPEFSSGTPVPLNIKYKKID